MTTKNSMTRCQHCGKKPKAVQSRSHSNIATKRRQFVNLQTKKIGGKRMMLCTSCIKTLQKNASKAEFKIDI